MRFYKKVYIFVGIFIALVGYALMPYMSFFIKDMPDNITDLNMIYLLFVTNSAISYFFSYKATFVTANQNNYIVVLNEGINEVIMVIVQIIALVLTKNYLLYLAIGIAFVLIKNLTITFIADKKYPYIKEKSKDKIPSDIFSSITKNTGAMVFHKVGSVIVFATDNLIISKYVGLISVGLYSNYCVITNAVTVFINKLFTGIAASVGNLAVMEKVEKQENVLKKMVFLNFWLYVFTCCCLFNLLNAFIGTIWLGNAYLLSREVVLLIVLKIYITGMRSAVQTFKNAKGLYWQNKFMPIGESVINLVASVILVQYMGVGGVLLGTVISSLATCVWIEPRVLYKHGFHKSPTIYYWQYIKYFLVFSLIMAVTYGINSLIVGGNIISFVVKCLISGLVPNVLMIMLYCKTEEYRYVKNAVLKGIKLKR
jgi:O-antigen/teichoic acid export membrane protein